MWVAFGIPAFVVRQNYVRNTAGNREFRHWTNNGGAALGVFLDQLPFCIRQWACFFEYTVCQTYFADIMQVTGDVNEHAQVIGKSHTLGQKVGYFRNLLRMKAGSMVTGINGVSQ